VLRQSNRGWNINSQKIVLIFGGSIVSDLINDFGYKPDTSLEVGIERFVKWYREFYGN